MIGRHLLPVPLVALALIAAGCGDERTSKDAKSDGSASTEQTASTTTEAAAPSVASGAAADKIAGEVGDDVTKAPKVPVTSGTPPKELEAKDVVVGDGPAAKLGDNVQVQYTLAVWGGKKVESSWDGGQPAAFPLVEGGLIEGWIKGVPGMKVGGRRVLVVPAALGYADQGTPDGKVKPGDTLVFIIDLVGTGQGG
ncbi:FKBP-type peptidyl-prolyl cis-trans isomerase (PPIase) [Patulibacter medicamentivorans]|uniref:Peptidyl-prolyl cis-trans isomerase n=1 Tax=Patulibacter medicamentivorans TaxID=1097667 RepID=H0E9Q3_9ACTN|nr:FKBP-type peptidyl-prolyl cis-trans isomerase [Patulibacter medicamentivorans]EHN09597.1 FKBP-type peptidyl-prolyl cis-trans isomerase (PPIase) [Patulibacter medicamentivorans]